jgi:hypothetical protein
VKKIKRGRKIKPMEAVSTSETSVNFYQTAPRNNPEEDIFEVP